MKNKPPWVFDFLIIAGVVLIVCAVSFGAVDFIQARAFCNSVNGAFQTNIIEYRCNGRLLQKFEGSKINSFNDFWEYSDFYKVNLSKTDDLQKVIQMHNGYVRYVLRIRQESNKTPFLEAIRKK